MELCGALVESSSIYDMNCVNYAQGFDVTRMNQLSVDSYFPVRLLTRLHRMLSEIKTLVSAGLYGHVPESMTRVTEFGATQTGTVHGVVFWFKVTLAPGVMPSNGPGIESHWTQAFSAFSDPIAVQKGRHYPIDPTLTEQAVSIACSRAIMGLSFDGGVAQSGQPEIDGGDQLAIRGCSRLATNRRTN